MQKKYASSRNLLRLLASEEKTNNIWTSTSSNSRPSRIRRNSNSSDKDNNIQKSKKRVMENKINNGKSRNDKENQSNTNDEKLSETSSETTSFALNEKPKKELKMSNVSANKGILKSDLKEKTNLSKNESYQLWVNEHIKSKSIDLPGRVSFSTNDVFEIDYSDYDETDKSFTDSPRKKPPTEAHSNYLMNIRDESDHATDETDETLTDLEPRCCALSRSNTGIYDSDLSKIRMESKAREEANKIVEEYKREIEELRKIHSQNPYASSSVSGAKTVEDFPNFFTNTGYQTNSLFQSTLDPINMLTTAGSSTNRNETQNSMDLHNEEKSDDKSSVDTKSDDICGSSKDSQMSSSRDLELSPIPVKLNNIWEKENNAKTHNNLYSKTTNVTATSNNAISIKNHLSIKPDSGIEMNRFTKAGKKLNDIFSTASINTKKKHKESKTRSIPNRVKSAPVSNSTKMRKSKSIPTLKDDHNIDEFHIDKIVSWMSIHDDSAFSDTASVTGGHMAEISKTNISIWKNRSGRTTTEDEGNFSTEDGVDTDSPYEEIVSVIKEIDDDKLNKG